MRDAGHRTPDAGHRTSDGKKSKNNISTPQGGGHNEKICLTLIPVKVFHIYFHHTFATNKKIAIAHL